LTRPRRIRTTSAGGQLGLFSEVYYDIETQKSADEVGGWGNISLMKVSVAVSYCETDGFRRWMEGDVPQMISYLGTFERVISFNGDRFDAIVLSAYGDVSALQAKSMDLLVDLKGRLGHRLTLDSLARATLKVGKTADGLQALRWWKEGKIEEIARYCQADVKVLVDLVAFARANGYVSYEDKFSGERRVPVSW